MKLKTCPICGHKAFLIEGGRCLHAVICSNTECYASDERHAEWYSSCDKAERAWNTIGAA